MARIFEKKLKGFTPTPNRGKASKIPKSTKSTPVMVWGFTLIELLVVIAIIGLIIAITLVTITRSRDRAKNTRIVTSLVQVRNTAANIYTNEGSYESICATDGTINESYSSLKAIEDDVNKFTGLNPVCHASIDSYCVQAELIRAGYYCVDSSGLAGEIPNSYCSAGNIKCTAP